MISGIILTKNEENNIVDAVESLSFCDEIVVIDDNSNDRTDELLKVLKNEHRRLEVYKHELKEDFASQRNFGLSKAKNEWVFFLDTDERVSQDLKDEIIQAVRLREVNGFYIERRDFMWGKELLHGETGKASFLRLGRKSKGKWEGKVHEKWIIEGNVRKLSGVIKHYPHSSLTDFLKDINFYTDIRAKELYGQGKKTNIFTLVAYPKAKFLINFFLKKGFLDGSRGFVIAMLMSLHSFLVRAKLWMLWQR